MSAGAFVASFVGTFEGADQSGVVGPGEELPDMSAGWFLDWAGANSTFPSCCKRGGLGSEVLSRIGGLVVMVLAERLAWRGLVDLESSFAGNVGFTLPSSEVNSSNALTEGDCSEVLSFFRVPVVAENPFEYAVDISRSSSFLTELARSTGFAGLYEVVEWEGMGSLETEAAAAVDENVDFCAVDEGDGSAADLPVF